MIKKPPKACKRRPLAVEGCFYFKIQESERMVFLFSIIPLLNKGNVLIRLNLV